VPSLGPDCRTCRFHYITYEQDWPYGCNAFEFKSKHTPSRVVEESSGEACRAYQPRSIRPSDGEDRDKEGR